MVHWISNHIALLLEIIAVIFGVFYVFLAAKNNNWCWIFGILGSAISIVLFLLYAVSPAFANVFTDALSGAGDVVGGVVGGAVSSSIAVLVGLVIVILNKIIPNEKTYAFFNAFGERLGVLITLTMSRWKWTAGIWNKTIEPYFIDLINNTVVSFINGVIKGLRHD